MAVQQLVSASHGSTAHGRQRDEKRKHRIPDPAQHSTAQHSTAQHSTAQHSSAQLSTAQHSTAQLSAAQHSSAQHSAAQPTLHTVAYACVQHVAKYYWREGSFRSLTLSATIGCHCAALHCSCGLAQHSVRRFRVYVCDQCRTVTSAEVRFSCMRKCMLCSSAVSAAG